MLRLLRFECQRQRASAGYAIRRIGAYGYSVYNVKRQSRIPIAVTTKLSVNCRDLRGLRVSVFHPRDARLGWLMAQLATLGCSAHAFWPPTVAPPEGSDLVLFAIPASADDIDAGWAQQAQAPAVLALVTEETPAALRLLQRLGATAVLPLPLQENGLKAAMLLARSLHIQRRDLGRRVQRLEQKLASLGVLSDAKAILIRTRNISEAQAYTLIRQQAMDKRVSTEQIAQAIVDANRVLCL